VLLVIYSSAAGGIVFFVGYSFSEVGRLCFMWGNDLLKWIYCVASDVNERVFYAYLFTFPVVYNTLIRGDMLPFLKRDVN
jgi:hypothetical protein